MRVAVLHDDVLSRGDASPDELGVLDALQAVSGALAELGHRPIPVAVTASLTGWVSTLAVSGAELVFNLCEGVGGNSALEVHAAAVVELMGLPMTGNRAETLALARRKDRVNALLAEAGVPVPAWTRADRLNGWHRFPAIVKPAAEDASVGITQDSIAPDAATLRSLVSSSRHDPLLVQEFLSGRELNVGIVAGQVLPLAEIVFRAPAHVGKGDTATRGHRVTGESHEAGGGWWPVVSYDAKWDEGSAEDLATTPCCPAELDDDTAREARALALAAWSVVEGRGYGRVDLRADSAGRLHVLEVNPNPDLAPGAGLNRMAAAHGWSYVDLIRHIVEEAT